MRLELDVNNTKIKVITINNKEFILLISLARYVNSVEPKIPIQTWMRNKDVIAYLCLCVKKKKFKGHKFTTFENFN